MKICKRGRHAIRYAAAAASDPLENHRRAAFRKWNRIRKEIFFVDQKKTNGSLLGIKKEEEEKKKEIGIGICTAVAIVPLQ